MRKQHLKGISSVILEKKKKKDYKGLSSSSLYTFEHLTSSEQNCGQQIIKNILGILANNQLNMDSYTLPLRTFVFCKFKYMDVECRNRKVTYFCTGH